MEIITIEWRNNKVRMIDQSKLPQQLVYLDIEDIKELWKAIKSLKVRGAPALGAAAALGIYLGIKNSKAVNFIEFSKDLESAAKYIASSRPTARNLFWGIERIKMAALINKKRSVSTIKKMILAESKKIIEEDKFACRQIGFYGAKLIRNGDRILTICNAGILATIDYGTALGVIYRAKQDGKKISVYACETRPILQGARLTTWELQKKGVDVTLITDNMAATLMQKGMIDKVIAGADRIASNGDTANKIGTYNLAVLADYHNVPFYIAAPASTFDLNIGSGQDIPIEQRDECEITDLFFKKRICPKGIKVFNPAFDVTPHKLITSIITDKGVIRQPYKTNIKRCL